MAEGCFFAFLYKRASDSSGYRASRLMLVAVSPRNSSGQAWWHDRFYQRECPHSNSCPFPAMNYEPSTMNSSLLKDVK